MKLFTLPDGTTVKANDQFQIGDQRYPGGWLLTAPDGDIASVGITVSTVADPAPPPITAVSSLDFIKLFTPAEQIAITTAAETDAQASLFMSEMAAATVINFDNPDVIQGLNYLISKNLLTSSRKAVILAGIRP